MGAWDTGPFGNDDAADWVIGLVDGETVDEVAFALEALAEAGSQPAVVHSCCRAVAAAEVVSAARGYACRSFPKELKAWIRDHGFYADRALTTTAKAAVRNILAGSELADEWDGDPGWKRRMNNLAKRLSQPSKVRRPSSKKRQTKAATDSDETKERVRQLRKLGGDVHTNSEGLIEQIDLSEGRATAADIALIGRISSLLCFAVYFDDFGDSDLKQLAQLPRLQELSIMNCEEVTDEGMKHVGKISTLEKLEVHYCPQITDAGLQHLSKLSRLKLIKARDTKVTKRGIAAFRRAVPGCKVDTKSAV